MFYAEFYYECFTFLFYFAPHENILNKQTMNSNARELMIFYDNNNCSYNILTVCDCSLNLSLLASLLHKLLQVGRACRTSSPPPHLPPPPSKLPSFQWTKAIARRIISQEGGGDGCRQILMKTSCQNLGSSHVCYPVIRPHIVHFPAPVIDCHLLDNRAQLFCIHTLAAGPAAAAGTRRPVRFVRIRVHTHTDVGAPYSIIVPPPPQIKTIGSAGVLF